jgi:hypothetical protein
MTALRRHRADDHLDLACRIAGRRIEKPLRLDVDDLHVNRTTIGRTSGDPARAHADQSGSLATGLSAHFNSNIMVIMYVIVYIHNGV